jgi:hypothetical protein
MAGGGWSGRDDDDDDDGHSLTGNRRFQKTDRRHSKDAQTE